MRASDQAVKAADGAAGDGDEQKRDDRRGILGVPVDQRGKHLQRRRRGAGGDGGRPEQGGHHQARDDQAEARDQLQAVDVVAGLQQQPDRQHAGDIAVGQQNRHPEPDRPAGDGAVDRLDQLPDRAAGPAGARAAGPQPDRGIHRRQRRQAGTEQIPALAMDPQADGHRDRNLQKDRQDRLGKLHEDAGDHPAKDRQHHPERKQQQHQKQQPDPGVEQPPGDLADGHAPVPEADDEHRHVVHAANQNRTDEHPDQRRSPAPHDRQGRPDDRPGAGDAGEVVAKDDRRGRRYKVAVVPQRLTRHGGCRIEPEETLGQPLAVEKIAQQQGCRRHCDQSQNHHRLALLRAGQPAATKNRGGR